MARLAWPNVIGRSSDFVSWRLRLDLVAWVDLTDAPAWLRLRLLSASPLSFLDDVFFVFLLSLLNGRICCPGETCCNAFFSFCAGESGSSSTFGAVDDFVVEMIAAVFVIAEPCSVLPNNTNDDKDDLDTDKVPVNELKDKTTRSDSFLYDISEFLSVGKSIKSTPSKLSVIAGEATAAGALCGGGATG